MPATGASICLFGLPDSATAYELRDFLQRSGAAFTWTPLHSDEEAQRLAGVPNLRDARLPVCVLPQGSQLFHPTVHELAGALNWFRAPKYDEYDLLIIGAGPAGLSAAVYGASEGLRTLLVERSAVGGQAGSSSRIENYAGFPHGISGWDLADRSRQQAQRLGAEIIVTDGAVARADEPPMALDEHWLASGQRIRARASICATGVAYNRLDLPDEARFLNRGLFYGAGASEATLCTGPVFVIGGGNSAGQAALNFARHAAHVTLLVRGAALKDTLSQYLLTRIATTRNITVSTQATLTRLLGENELQAIEYRCADTGAVTTAETTHVFVCIGGRPQTDWAAGRGVLTDRAGYLLTGQDIAPAQLPPPYWPAGRTPLHMETSRPGLFAAGDVRHNSVKRCATAVGDGATAVSMVHQFLAQSRA
ncbi:MAG: NAD(P)/FAD-dependent oxidoreductase [Janthinobacterium lividum]